MPGQQKNTALLPRPLQDKLFAGDEQLSEMNNARTIVCGLFAGAALLLAGCNTEPPSGRVFFGKSTVNGKPVLFELDTGSPTTVIYDSSALRLGLKRGDSTQAVGVTVGGQSFTAPLPVFRPPFSSRLPGSTEGEDGLVGWPEIRGNILLFDSDHQVVRGLDRLPPDTAGWLKLKVLPSRWLLLETPLPDGKKGVILVDTGAPLAVQLGPEQWKRWTRAHPKTRVSAHRGASFSFGTFEFKLAWANDVQLGPLTLSNVWLETMPDSEADFFQKATVDTNAVWSLGTFALRGIDLIVDGKNGWAYVRSRHGPAPAAGRWNWTVAGDVRIKVDNLYLMAGEDAWLKRNIHSALTNFDLALKLNPDNGDAYCDRGDVRSAQDDAAGAISDYTRALALNPEDPDAWSGRGMARETAGDYSGAVSDYDKFISLRPDDSAYERLFREILLRRLGRARGDFAKTVAAWKPSWTKTVGQFLAGELDEEKLLAAAKKKDKEPSSGQKCEAYYYIGIKRLEAGDKSGAREWFQKCRATDKKDYTEFQFAGAELALLNAASH